MPRKTKAKGLPKGVPAPPLARTNRTANQLVAPHTREACLVVIYGSELARKFNLDAESLTLGRSNKCDVQIDQESVSRAHSKITNVGRTVRIRDLGSTNGTYVNDELVEECTLADGDFIKIGRTIFKFLSGKNIERAYHEEIYHLTAIDGLTQIYNTRYFSESLRREIARATRYSREMSLMMFEIDHLQAISADHGHLAKDAVLKTLAFAIKVKLRSEDIFARLDNDEFAITLPETSGPSAHRYAELILATTQSTAFSFEGTTIPVTLSIGVATLEPEDPSAERLIKITRDCLHYAEASGRNRVVPATDLNRQRIPLLSPSQLRDHLAAKTFQTCFAASVLQRRRYAAMDGGAGILARLDDALVRSLAAAVSTDDCLGVLRDGCTFIVGLADSNSNVVSSLASRVEEQLFDRERERSGCPPARVVCGKSVSLADALGGGTPEKKVSLAIGAAAQFLTSRQAEAERGEQLPLPIADAYRRLGSQVDPTNSVHALFSLVETISRWLLALVIGEALAAGPKSKMEVQDLLRSRLKGRVTDGQWLKMIERVREIVLRDVPNSGRAVSLLGSGFNELVAVLKELVTARNQFTHAMDKTDPACAKELAEDLTPKLEVVMSACVDMLSRSRPFQVYEIDVVPSLEGAVSYRYNLRWLLGDNPVIAPSNVASGAPIQRGIVCAGDPARDAVVVLDPFVLYERCPDCQQHEIFFLERIEDDQVIYKSLPRSHIIQAVRLTIGTRQQALSWLVQPTVNLSEPSVLAQGSCSVRHRPNEGRRSAKSCRGKP